MRHVFRAQKFGWDEEQEGVWFDSDDYTREEAEAEFHAYEGSTRDGYPFTGYEYDGQKYYNYLYLGEFEDDKMPRSNKDFIASLSEEE